MPGADLLKGRLALMSAGFLLLLATAAIGVIPQLNTHVLSFLGLYAVAFAAYVLAARTVLRASACGRGVSLLIVGVCVIAHATLIPARPELSTDIYRYAWEGRLIVEGHNPFSTSPDDSAFVALRDGDHPRISHQKMPTIYPPLAQGAFALVSLVHPGPAALKTLFSLANVGTVLLLFRILRRRGRPEQHAILFAWNPLVIVETGHSGHVDALAIFFLVLALDLWDSKRRVWAGLMLGASTLLKYLAVATVPWLLRRKHIAAVVIVILVIVAGYAPFMDAGLKLFTSLREYSANWWFNGPPFIALSGFLGDQTLARRLLLAVCLAFAVAAAQRERDLARYTYLIVGAALFASPTVYPWYLIWIVPLLCLFPSRAWIAFTGLVMLSYLVWNVYNESGAWVLPTWILALEYAPFYLLLMAGLARGRRRALARA